MPASRRRGEPGKSSSPLSSVFSRPALAGVPADFSEQKNNSRRPQTGRTEGKK